MTRRDPLLARCPVYFVLVIAPALALTLGLAFALCLGGCSKPSSIDKPEPGLQLVARTSPENVLYDLRSIYDGADALMKTEADTLYWAGMYGSLFHPDSFKFYFIPADTPPQFPEGWWGFESEVASFENMLRRKVRGTLDDIKLDWVANLSEPDPRVGHTGWRLIQVSGILLDIVVGTTIYRVSNGAANFCLAPDPANPTLWVITEWWDESPASGSPLVQAALSGEMTTWGHIKALFH
jgi:hypothetical protein